jgi:flagellar protein FlaJ
VRKEKEKEKMKFEKKYGIIEKYFPWLERKMKEANMEESPDKFISSCVQRAVLLTVIILIGFLSIFLYYGLDSLRIAILMVLLLIILFPLSFLYWIQLPKAMASKRRREIERDVLFAGYHVYISLKGGVPLFDALSGVAKGSYGEVSKEFEKIVNKVAIGVPIDKAAEDVIEYCPSPTLKRILIQLINAIRSGTDVAESLATVLNQLSKEQIIEIREYGQKLNPVVMFYLVLGVILPCLGATIGLLILSFGKLSVTFSQLLLFIPVIAIFQIIFITYAEIIRPVYEV